MKPLTEALNELSPIAQRAQEALDAVVGVHQLPRHTQLLKIGQVARSFYFVERGLLRVYFVRNGMDITDDFVIDTQFGGFVESLVTGQPSQRGIQLLEDSDLFSLTHADFESLCSAFHDIERAGRKLATFAFLGSESRIESVRFLSAKERYHELERKYPGITNRAPLRHIASFLGTTPASVSRIRAGLQ
jgi:CRP-like cAMP-binding protein